MAAVGRGRLGDLHRQLARRRQDEDARAVDRALLAPLASVSARAARTRCSAGRMNDAVLPLPVRGGDHQVGAGERRRDGARLDVGGLVVAGIGDGADEGSGRPRDSKVIESCLCLKRARRRRLVRGSAAARRKRSADQVAGKKARRLRSERRREQSKRRHRRRPCRAELAWRDARRSRSTSDSRRSEGMNESPTDRRPAKPGLEPDCGKPVILHRRRDSRSVGRWRTRRKCSR